MLSLARVTRRFGATLPRLRPLLVLAVGAVTLLSRLQLPAFAATRDGKPAPARTVLPSPDDCPPTRHAAPAAPAPSLRAASVGEAR